MKKQRKLFAILTLVAFMMTLLPVAAFAADDVASLGWSQIYAEDDYVDADNKDLAGFTVELKNQTGNLTNEVTSGSTLVIWAERANEQVSDVDVFTDKDGNKLSNKFNKAIIKVAPQKSTTVYLKSGKAGVVTVKAAIVDSSKLDSESVCQKNVVENNAVQIRDTAKTEFEAARSTDWTYKFTNRGSNEALSTTQAVNGGKANGIDKKEFDFFVVDKQGNAVVGEKVKLSVNKNGALVDTDEEITDKRGKIEFGVTATDNDTYRVTAEVAGEVNTLVISFTAAEAYKIEISDQPTASIALDSDPGIEFKVYDINGNLIEEVDQTLVDELNGKAANHTGDKHKYHQVISTPSGSKVEDKDLTFRNVKVNDLEDTLYLDFSRKPDKVGTYKVKVSLANGKSEIVSFDVKEQGKIVNMTMDIKENSIAWEKSTRKPTVKLYDADGTYKKEDSKIFYNYTWTVDNTALASVATYGDDAGVVKAKKGSDYNYKTGTVTVTVLDESRNLTATDTLVIGSDVSSVKVAENGKAVVGEKATVKLQVVDADGNNIALDANKREKINVDLYKTSAPADAKLDWNLPIKSAYQKTLSRTGELVFDVTSDVVGDVTFQVVIKQDFNDNDKNVSLSIPVTVSFKADAPKVGAEQVTLLIGTSTYIVDGVVQNSDLAPFIKDNRTFVPVRVVATALGCENVDTMWDEATQTVKLVREDMTATAVIGQQLITVEKDGVTTTVSSDVAPFIKDGRTVLPFRVLSEIFGAEVEAIAAADGTTASVTFTQTW
ncbi:Copper amine oxidase N-terminal domain-containing protein [Desulfonispora thiosulfatigenes DSM 11270]|uniref:Copper amine oxidase N-terminal domain-containing protein n=1 Tax=Desulfonispora thiosulfatigenes DSM 11270 TaxID=656914 RepID=A0A1W1V5I4_DESTI|nr:stalk domain-containing protein [Desulfonispora thiosulfatigenes]SMB88301.1 Copper amine oxidase N-terminal domain-containing protein [Desulfonispora thiosulfatigenes DSM 11270]